MHQSACVIELAVQWYDVEEGSFFKCMLEYLCKIYRYTDILFVLQNDWIVKYKIKLIYLFITIFSLTASYSTLDNFVSHVWVCIQIHTYLFILERVKNKWFISPKKGTCGSLFMTMRNTFKLFQLQFLYLKNEVNTW